MMADHADDGQDQVPGGDPVSKLSGQVEAQCLGHQDPGAAGHHTVQVVRAADAGPKRAERAVRACVAVRAEDQLAGTYMLLQHDLVAYARAFVEPDPVLPGKIAHLLLRSRSLGAVAGHVVVHDPDKLVLVRDPGLFQAVVHINSKMCGPVVAHQIVELDGMDLAGVDGLKTCCAGDDLFGYCHSHSGSSKYVICDRGRFLCHIPTGGQCELKSGQLFGLSSELIRPP